MGGILRRYNRRGVVASDIRPSPRKIRKREQVRQRGAEWILKGCKIATRHGVGTALVPSCSCRAEDISRSGGERLAKISVSLCLRGNRTKFCTRVPNLTLKLESDKEKQLVAIAIEFREG